MTTKVLFAALLPWARRMREYLNNTAPGTASRPSGATTWRPDSRVPGLLRVAARHHRGLRQPRADPRQHDVRLHLRRLILTTMKGHQGAGVRTTLLDSNCDDDDYPMTPIQDAGFVLGSAKPDRRVRRGALGVLRVWGTAGRTSACIGPMDTRRRFDHRLVAHRSSSRGTMHRVQRNLRDGAQDLPRDRSSSSTTSS